MWYIRAIDLLLAIHVVLAVLGAVDRPSVNAAKAAESVATIHTRK
jgi:hypothetical protein